MRLQFDRNIEESNEYRRKFDLAVRDNKRLQEDLLTLTRENQVKANTHMTTFPDYLVLFIRLYNKNLNIPLMIKKILNYKFRNISNKFQIAKMLLRKRKTIEQH